ncbi:uncharacterized protein LOC104445656 [Eucalyptus grandis]|uniref:uncharacterized protein LOC104445656 n=1 Tax=Eucalyptus grandis TaxID=71139 RepID=UPI00192EA176|nr:uncharacterized protein LOC104445656 [Eucalyptus grandis]
MSPQHRSHVPKFGSWDRGKDEVRYTAYFDNARQEKAGVRINPNDPEENPEAFMPGPICDMEKIFNSVQAISSTKRQGSQVSAPVLIEEAFPINQKQVTLLARLHQCKEVGGTEEKGMQPIHVIIL